MLTTANRLASRTFAVLLAAAALTLLAACGGGGGDAGDGDGQVGVIPAGSVWDLRASLFIEGVFVETVDLGEVSGEAIPTPQALAAATVSLPALQYAELFEGYTVSVAGDLIRLTDPDTDYLIRIDDFAYSDYLSCGGCGLGSSVSFKLGMEIAEGGRLDGLTVPEFTVDVAVIHTFTRVE